MIGVADGSVGDGPAGIAVLRAYLARAGQPVDADVLVGLFSGVALAPLAAVSGLEPSWDRVLLLSTPPAHPRADTAANHR